MISISTKMVVVYVMNIHIMASPHLKVIFTLNVVKGKRLIWTVFKIREHFFAVLLYKRLMEDKSPCFLY